MSSDSYYDILEIPETASLDDIKKSYRRLSMIYHPDKNRNNPESTSKFQKISEAYETLSDVTKKNEYDMMRNNPFAKIMGMGMGMGPMGMGMRFSPNPNGMSHENPIDDLFSNLFGMHGHGPNIRIFHNGQPMNINMNQTQKPPPIVKNVSISIDKILSETTMPIDIERWIIENGNKVFENETIYVTIPKGADDGEIILLKDKGNVLNENSKGDVKLFIKVENNTEFKRNGLDLIYEKNITVKEALCGFTFELKFLTGKVYTINNNSGNIICDKYQKIIPNMGFSRDNIKHSGNLIILFHVKFPEKLTEDVMNQLKSIDF
jgi:DnaJ-class molecular chaperone